MNTLIVSYSYTGNNETIAKGLAHRIGADHIAIAEQSKRSLFTIVLDIVFNRTPKINDISQSLNKYDNFLFIAPVWLGKVATPLRNCFKTLKNKIDNYSFVSFSASGNNSKLGEELFDLIGKEPKVVLNPLIIDLFPANSKPSHKDLNSYRLGDNIANKIIENVEMELKKVNFLNV
ncbi:MAG: hypothetical protein C0598_05825 [Marinilabiliales bacterium]|nr:MAG: hypothetical protein C0598_05825 [Marinilabiliales bacterium]